MHPWRRPRPRTTKPTVRCDSLCALGCIDLRLSGQKLAEPLRQFHAHTATLESILKLLEEIGLVRLCHTLW